MAYFEGFGGAALPYLAGAAGFGAFPAPYTVPPVMGMGAVMTPANAAAAFGAAAPDELRCVSVGDVLEASLTNTQLCLLGLRTLNTCTTLRLCPALLCPAPTTGLCL